MVHKIVAEYTHGLQNFMMRMIGPLALTPGRHYANMRHPRVPHFPLLRSSIFQVDLLARLDVRNRPTLTRLNPGPQHGLSQYLSQKIKLKPKLILIR